MKNTLLVAGALLISGATGRTLTVYNKCSFTIWPAIFTDMHASTSKPSHATGWEAKSESRVSFNVPDNWKAGRIWGRRNCDFRKSGSSSCLSGGCNGGLLCDASSGTGVSPVTVAEWTLQGKGNHDYYDVSLVDGFNLPMRIDNNKGCPVASCPADLNPNCPAPLKAGALGCKSACQANLDGNPGNSPNCCTGSHKTAATCFPSGVAHYSYFKNSCPNSYVYAYDETSKTALFTCPSSGKADYTLTFCP